MILSDGPVNGIVPDNAINDARDVDSDKSFRDVLQLGVPDVRLAVSRSELLKWSEERLERLEEALAFDRFKGWNGVAFTP